MNDSFWKQVKKNQQIVKTWDKWKQKISITAESCATGKFIMSEREWKERYGNL